MDLPNPALICANCSPLLPSWFRGQKTKCRIFDIWYFELIRMTKLNNKISLIAKYSLNKIHDENEIFDKNRNNWLFVDSWWVKRKITEIQEKFDNLIEKYQQECLEALRKEIVKLC